MRISSIALTTLTALMAWDTHHPVTAAPSPIALPADDGSVTSPSSAVAPPVGVRPETVMQPEFLRDRRMKKEIVSSDRESISVTGSDQGKVTDSLSVSKSEATSQLAAKPELKSELVAVAEKSIGVTTPNQPEVESARKRDENVGQMVSLGGDRGDRTVIVAQIPPPTDPAPVNRFPAEDKPAPLNAEDVQSELGEIKVLNRPTEAPPSRKQPTVQLLLRSGVFTSSNTTALRDFPNSDTVFTNSALLLATPKLGPNTRLIASAGGNLLRLANSGDANYNTLSFNVAVQQRLAAGTYGQLGWVQDTLYRQADGQRLLRDNAVQFLLGRQDQLSKKLRLDSFYELKASFTNPDEQSRVANTLGARLRYDLTPKWQGALDYRLTFKSFTQVDRADTEHQVTALAIYNLSPDLFLAGSVSYLFGRSSNPSVDVRNFAIGISLGFNLPLF